MTIHFRRARAYLENFDFKSLFVEELGWARAGGRPAIVPVDSGKFSLTPVAELGGMIVYVCEIGDIPPAGVRKKIDKEISKLAFEHIIIFMDTARAKAVWLWVKREAGASAKARENTYRKGEPGALLLQKLAGIAFNIEELDDEGRASIAAVVGKVAKAFDVENITKRFYDQFKDEHTAFLKFIKGVDEADDRAWYASVILDRLMFIYFIQRKGFLDGDHDYLLNKLKQSKAKGRDRYYCDFLTALFFEGFAQEENERPAAVRKLLGRVPYLNGGLFLPHALEQKYGDKIQIPDSMFERLFEFFNQWDWHLDDRPPETRKENEINP
ncbi:MAG TPA: hypothetical protein VJ020_01800, partial [Anaerolineales bacterium]|nr:hypothetical protein [Anaerolineales bacterium]